MSSRTTITSSTLLLKTPTVRTTSQKSSLSMDLGEFWGLPCAVCTVQWSVHGTATALPIFHWKLSNIVKTAKNISTIIIISSFAWFLIAVATRCHLHCNNLDYSIQARGAANSNGSETRRLRAAGSLQVLHPCWPLRGWPDQHKYRNGTCVVISINIFLPRKTSTETTPERSLKISISILWHYWRVFPSLI